ncbi:MAG: hypothetical protein IPM81_02730 [Saprospirales bacterium]|nr:hypothetical protein [Saprospirales bacterium]
MKPNHLYEIVDKVGEDTFKYGISSDPIGEDGMSDRMKTSQLPESPVRMGAIFWQDFAL